jgi:transcriptional regulator of acetoin/glycerol metabolism
MRLGLAATGVLSINCAAIPAELIESELFGYRPGAFTGATPHGSRGRLLDADGGTLFLDEIGDMSLGLQSRLLQVLSEGEFVPIGGTETLRVQFALISASVQDIAALVGQGRFREDLYYRINGATLTLPPLRDRSDREDLIDRAFVRAAMEAGTAPRRVKDEVRQVLMQYPWPGNMRQLQHVARFAIAVSDDPILDVRCLPALFDDVGRHRPPFSRTSNDQAAIETALAHTGWNVSAAAIRLGISRATLHRRLRALSLQRPRRTRH